VQRLWQLNNAELERMQAKLGDVSRKPEEEIGRKTTEQASCCEFGGDRPQRHAPTLRLLSA
jgi:hypothetical protein